jgi:hypothetical protein
MITQKDLTGSFKNYLKTLINPDLVRVFFVPLAQLVRATHS